MAKFMVLYNSPIKASQNMAQASPEEMKASMDEWIAWRDEVIKSVGFEFGLPLEPVGLLSSSGQTDSSSRVSGYATMEADNKETVMELLKSHPHLKREESSIDVFEMLSMPGIEA